MYLCTRCFTRFKGFIRDRDAYFDIIASHSCSICARSKVLVFTLPEDRIEVECLIKAYMQKKGYL